MKRILLTAIPAFAAVIAFAQPPAVPEPEVSNPQMSLRIYTEDFAPFNYGAENGQVTGQVTEVVREIMKRLGVQTDIRLLPWANGYKRIQSQTGSALFSMARTDEREDLFQWVGPVGSYEQVIYAMKDSDYVIHSLDKLRASPPIAVVRDAARHQLLQKNHITNILLYADDTECFRALKKGEAGLMAGTPETMPIMARQAGLEPDELAVVYHLRKYPLHVAFSKDVPAEVISRWQKTLDQMTADGTMDSIHARLYKTTQAPATDGKTPSSEEVSPVPLAAEIDSRLGQFLDVLQKMALTEEAHSGEWARLKPLLAASELAAPDGRIWYALPNGSYSTPVDDQTSSNIKDRKYFPVVMAGQSTLGNIVSSKSTGRPVVIAATPILRAGDVIGVLGTSIYLQDINDELLSAFPLPEDQMFFAVHTDGTIALHSTDSWIGQPLGDFEPQGLLRRALTKEKGKCSFAVGGRIWEAAWVTAPRTGWRVFAATGKTAGPVVSQ